MKNKPQIRKWDQVNLKSFAYQKKTLKERQGQHSEYKEIFAKEETLKEFISKTYKLLVQLIIKNIYKPRKKKKKSQSFSKENLQMGTWKDA